LNFSANEIIFSSGETFAERGVYRTVAGAALCGRQELVMTKLTNAVLRRPGTTIAVVVLLTAVFGAFASQAVIDDGAAVDNELTAAQDTLDDAFGDQTQVLQIMVESTDGSDVRSVAGLETVTALEQAVRDSDVAATLVEERSAGQPAIVSYLGPAAQAAQQQGAVGDLGDSDVRALQARALEQLPPPVAALYDGLIGEPTSDDVVTTGLVLVFQDTAGLDEDGALDQQRALVNVVQSVAPAQGVTVAPLSIPLLLADSEVGGEVGRLFGTALLIITAVLAVVYWVMPRVRPRLPATARMGRRTAADVALTLAVIVLAVVWMQGLGVLLGPGYADVIGAFSPQTQIVPILIVGLGVDFGIHLLARYRAELGAPDGDAGAGIPARAFATAGRTVGVTLLLCTAATAIGFLTNLASPVEFLATLGVLAAAGITAAFVLTMTLVPAVRMLLDRRAARVGRLPAATLASQRTSTLPRAIGRTSWLAERVPTVTLAVAVLLVGVGGYGYTQLDTRFEITDFVPQDDPALATFETLQEQFAGGFDERTEVLLTGDVVTPDAHNALIAALDSVGDVDAVATLGSRADATSIASVLAPVFSSGGASPDAVRDELTGLGLRPDLTVAPGADVDALYAAVASGVSGAEQVLAHNDSGDWIGRVSLRTTAGQEGAAALRDDLRSTFDGVTDAGASAIVTSPEIVQAQLGQDVEDSQLLSLLIALGAAMALLVVYYTVTARRPVVGVLTVLPVGVVLALTFGTMALTGIPLNPVTATLAALSIGIGVPFTIHVTSRFLEERARPDDGDPGSASTAPASGTALRRTMAQTGGALVGSALTTAIGFGILTTSTLVPFEQLGYVIVYAITYSVVAAILVLPSLLALWDRWDRRRRVGAPSDAPGLVGAGRGDRTPASAPTAR
jgi:predicted RND superfamily exporter protein